MRIFIYVYTMKFYKIENLMVMQTTKKIAIILFLLALTPWASAQKGVGNDTGIAARTSVNETKQISGILKEVVTEPCTQTTGRYSNGTHLLVRTKQGSTNMLNLHLGPTEVLSDQTGLLKTGQSLQLEVYCTDDLADYHYIVKEYTYKGETYEIRDASLRPFWAGNRRGMQSSGR